MSTGNNIYHLRKNKGLTQSDIAGRLNVSFQSVSLWERDEAIPDIDNLIALSELFNVSLDRLVKGDIDKEYELSSRLFDEKKMYTFIKTYARENELRQTLYALPLAREKHAGQYRKGKDKVPYIYHPLLMTCHAISLGLKDDDILSVCLLHDVIEDTDTDINDLAVSDNSKMAIELLSKSKGYNNVDYYNGIKDNETALLVKAIDRCNNVSHMASGFNEAKIRKYIAETEEFVYPLIKYGQDKYPGHSGVLFVLKYHIKSVIESLKRFL
ncbi:MAG: helix-turn-helix domain-containing protein [Erysipelotrichaceae bacterium]